MLDIPGARNWPFLILTIFPVEAAARIRSVCLQRKAGICSTSEPGPLVRLEPHHGHPRAQESGDLDSPAGGFSSPFSNPAPIRVDRGAIGFVVEPLKIKGIFRPEVISFNRPAMSRQCASLSITHGPAIKNRGCCHQISSPKGNNGRLASSVDWGHNRTFPTGLSDMTEGISSPVRRDLNSARP